MWLQRQLDILNSFKMHIKDTPGSNNHFFDPGVFYNLKLTYEKTIHNTFIQRACHKMNNQKFFKKRKILVCNASFYFYPVVVV